LNNKKDKRVKKLIFLAPVNDIKIPILAIFGSEDNYQFEPKEKLELLKNIIKCDTYLIQNSNHWFTSHENELTKKVLNWVI